MNYKDNITRSMTWLGKQEKTVFLGEGLVNAGRIYNTLTGVPKKKCLEMPICENLIVGSAIGLALDGWRPVVVFQRMDFMLIAADAIINHLAIMPKWHKNIKLPIIIRAIVGSQSKKFRMGEQHNHDFTELFEPYIETVNFHNSRMDIEYIYKHAYKIGSKPTLIIEEKDLYGE